MRREVIEGFRDAEAFQVGRCGADDELNRKHPTRDHTQALAFVGERQAAGAPVQQTHTESVDVSSRDSVQALVKTATALGNITGLIHAAGVSPSQASPASILRASTPSAPAYSR